MISIVIPAFNEEESLTHTINNILNASQSLQANAEIIIINDGSTDNTYSVAEELKKIHPNSVKVIHFKQNHGIGYGFKEALKIASHDYITSFPGDNACRQEIVKKLLSNIGKADFIITFLVNTEDRSFIRRTISSMYSYLWKLVFNLPINYVNGSAVYNTKQLRSLNLRSDRYGIFAEINVKLLRSGVDFAELPDFVKKNQTKSSSLSFKNLQETMRTMFMAIYDVYFSHKKKYSKVPNRIILDC